MNWISVKDFKEKYHHLEGTLDNILVWVATEYYIDVYYHNGEFYDMEEFEGSFDKPLSEVTHVLEIEPPKP